MANSPYSKLVQMGFESSKVHHALELSNERFEDAALLLSDGALPPVPQTRYEMFVAELDEIPGVSEVAMLENPFRLGFTLTIGNLRTRMFFMNPPIFCKGLSFMESFKFKLPQLFTVTDPLG